MLRVILHFCGSMQQIKNVSPCNNLWVYLTNTFAKELLMFNSYEFQLIPKLLEDTYSLHYFVPGIK